MIHNTKYSLTIGWLYPELMNTYGDRGNIIVLEKRCQWRGIEVNIQHLDLGFRISDLQKSDLLFMGGAQDRQQKIVALDFNDEKTKILKEMINTGTPGLFICGAYQFLGKYYQPATGKKIPGLGILDIYTIHPGEAAKRLIGNITINITNNPINKYYKSISNFKFQISNSLVGFENHGGRTYLGKGVRPLGKVVSGFGNNGEDKTEGAVYKNIFGTYLHGPLLPKNPDLADLLIKLALEKKYKKSITLSPLDDSLEHQAHNFILKKFS